MLQVMAAVTNFGYILRIFAYLLLFVFGGYLFYSAVGSPWVRGQHSGRPAVADAITIPIIPRPADNRHQH